jgi:hypothetical protein
MKKVLLIAATLVVGILIGSVVMGTALAATPAAEGTPTPVVPGSGYGRGGMMRNDGMMGNGGMMGRGNAGSEMGMVEDEVLALLNMTSDQLTAERQAGKSLVQIAQAQGVTEQQLINAILAAKRTDLDKLVNDGKLTRAQADQMYQNMQQAVPQAVNRTTAGPMWGNGNGSDECPVYNGEQTPSDGQRQNGRPGRGGMNW